MILKGKERGDATQLGRYLLAMRENDHVELHEVRGFISEDLLEAFGEADAIASGTRCRNHLFSLSLNPPQKASVPVEAFEQAIARIEEKLGRTDQPRAVIFHEKDGRRHAHVVWSRINAEQIRAINLPHYKVKLRDVSRQLFLDHGWDMPRGLQNPLLRDPLSYMGEEAVARSTRADRSRDPLYNQLKMYAELFRTLGWLHPCPQRDGWRTVLNSPCDSFQVLGVSTKTVTTSCARRCCASRLRSRSGMAKTGCMEHRNFRSRSRC
ncbi:MAG: hypothetical protein V4516_01585 [Pseudomonadota bacterium]